MLSKRTDGPHDAPALVVTTVSCMEQWVTELEDHWRDTSSPGKAQRERLSRTTALIRSNLCISIALSIWSERCGESEMVHRGAKKKQQRDRSNSYQQ